MKVECGRPEGRLTNQRIGDSRSFSFNFATSSNLPLPSSCLILSFGRVKTPYTFTMAGVCLLSTTLLTPLESDY